MKLISVARHPCILNLRGTGGRPLAGITFVVERASEPVPEMAYVTDSNGRAHLGLPPGDAAIRFFLPNGIGETQVIRIVDEVGRTYTVQLVTNDRP